MSDKNQVARVADIVAEGVAVWDDDDSVLIVYDGQDWVSVDVIELTEERRYFGGEEIKPHRRRLVSKWEAVDE